MQSQHSIQSVISLSACCTLLLRKQVLRRAYAGLTQGFQSCHENSWRWARLLLLSPRDSAKWCRVGLRHISSHKGHQMATLLCHKWPGTWDICLGFELNPDIFCLANKEIKQRNQTKKHLCIFVILCLQSLTNYHQLSIVVCLSATLYCYSWTSVLASTLSDRVMPQTVEPTNQGTVTLARHWSGEACDKVNFK